MTVYDGVTDLVASTLVVDKVGCKTPSSLKAFQRYSGLIGCGVQSNKFSCKANAYQRPYHTWQFYVVRSHFLYSAKTTKSKICQIPLCV